MRNSPISHLRNTRDFGESPYRSIVQNRSTQRQNNYSPERTLGDTEYWRQRARSLEAENLALNEELVFQGRKIDKIDDLQSKIQVLLNQNSHLIDQNENLIKLIQQKKAQTQLWKSKFQGEYSNVNIAQSEKKKIFQHLNLKDQENQYQIQKLMAQISRLHDQLEQMESLKQIQLNMLKNKYENETINQIQSLKRSQYGNNEVHELNIRKLKDTVKQKQFQIENMKRQAKLQNERLNGQINFLKSEIKKIEHQRQHEFDLLKTEHENSKNNLLRAHRKNEEEMKNLHQAKVKRLMHEIEEKKNEIEDCYGKIKKGGKQNQAQLTNMVNEKSKLRIQMRENDNVNREKINQITNFYENQLSQLRQNDAKRQKNLIQLYDSQLATLKEIIDAKQEEIQRLLQLNADIRRNQQVRLNDIKKNNQQLKSKIQDLVMHYEREVQLMKIKVSELYEADLQALRSNTKNRLALNYREKENLRELLQQTQDKYAKAVQDNLDLRIQYENRLTEFKIKYERQHQQLLDMIAMHEKQNENLTSRASATHISHHDLYQKQNLNRKELMNQKRNLQKQIINKNKQIQSLNLRIQTMQGYSKKQITKLQQQILKLKNQHQVWISKQDKETQQWKNQRTQLKERNHELDRKLQDTNLKRKENEEKLQKKIEELRFKVAQHEGTIQQLREKCQILESKNKVEIGNLDKARLQSEALMNTEKEKLSEVRSRQKQLFTDENIKVINELKKQIQGLKNENQILRDHNEKSKIRQAELNTEISNLLDSVNKRNLLEQHVINIGLSNNYFKNVAEIFKKKIQP